MKMNVAVVLFVWLFLIHKGESRTWSPSFSFPESPLEEMEGEIFTGKTDLKNRKFTKNVLSRGPLKATGVVFTTVLVQGPFAGQKVEADKITVQGMGHITDSARLNAVVCQGQVALKKVHVGHLQYSGDSKLETVEASVVEGNGALSVKDSQIETVSLSGNIQAWQTTFSGTVTLGGKRHYFEGCTINNLVVRSKKAEVHLTKGTKVTGSITFEEGDGVIYIDGATSKKVQVKGAKIS